MENEDDSPKQGGAATQKLKDVFAKFAQKTIEKTRTSKVEEFVRNLRSDQDGLKVFMDAFYRTSSQGK